jgi:butyryl-CoA dehydrogenase
MHFELTEEQKLVQQTARELAEREIAPAAAAFDREHRYPAEMVAKLVELGLMGVAIPDEYGGAGMDYVSYVVAMEEISAACAGTGVIMSVNNSLVCDPLLKYGTAKQKKEVLAPLASGRKLGCFGLTEPAAGSDASKIRTTAVRDGDSWVLNGEKNFITNAPQADWAIIFAYTDKAQRHKGISTFLVPRETPGYSTGPYERKLGIRASHSSSIHLEDCRIPGDLLLGEIGQGFKVAMTTLDAGRIGIAAQALGIARAALHESVIYAKERQAFGGPIANLQAIQFMLADMATRLDAARLLTLRAAHLKDIGQPFSKESAMAKLFAAETAMWVTTKAIQVHGGYGYLEDFAAERHFRDAKITEIYEGTSEIQRLVIAASLLRE